MCRFYDLDKGRILLNGKDATDINVYEYRKYFSLVAQEATLFQGTIRENILLGVDPSSITDEQLHKVCRDASIHDFIVSLPEGYNTNIGSRGVSLSGGQKQRVAIARALIRDPKVLLLDEATSSLDSESEKLVQAAFERASEGRTMLVVAHRLATVQNADVIFVLGDGQLLEQGSHAELLKQRGVYWHMVSDSLSLRFPEIVELTLVNSVKARLWIDKARWALKGLYDNRRHHITTSLAADVSLVTKSSYTLLCIRSSECPDGKRNTEENHYPTPCWRLSKRFS